jgi:hypothetical protein
MACYVLPTLGCVTSAVDKLSIPARFDLPQSEPLPESAKNNYVRGRFPIGALLPKQMLPLSCG